MRAYKGFTKDLRAKLGKGRDYKPNEVVVEKSSKCARSGLHCAENPLDCFDYYSVLDDNVYWLVEAGGSIDEDDWDSKIACTELKLIKELSIKEMVGHVLVYMVKHPLREWEKHRGGCVVAPDRAKDTAGKIAIARGTNPSVAGKKGAVLGLVREADGEITAVHLIEIDGVKYKEETWYTLDSAGNVCRKEVAAV
ncbi:MAG: hypothetical protein J6K15_06210 [Lachnospiraceae bacterium]|nr:hypothetical protein [Lachnospiraceae bacterium]